MVNEDIKKAVNKWSNSFLRPLIPPKLLSNSEIKGTEDDGAKLIYLKFLYGIKTGRISTQPTDGGIYNVVESTDNQSLWLYSLQKDSIPEGFNPIKKKDSGFIPTGDIRKCGTCRGTGKVRCKSCGGKVRWTSKNLNGDLIENVCSCGDGKQMCSNCDGFGDVEIIILTQREFNLFETKNSQYNGEVPQEKVKKITGDLIYEQVYDYPFDILQGMLVGGIDANEFDRLNNEVLEFLKQSIDYQLKERGDIDTDKIHSQLDSLFNSLPNPGKENKVLEHEAMPIRVMVKVENAPVKQINYKYKEKDYSLWVYGKENSVWKKSSPITFNYKIIILLCLIIGGLSTWAFKSLNSSKHIPASTHTFDYREKINNEATNQTQTEKENIITNNYKASETINEDTDNQIQEKIEKKDNLNFNGNWRIENENSYYRFNSNGTGNYKNSRGKDYSFKWSLTGNNLKVVMNDDSSIWVWRINSYSNNRIEMYNSSQNIQRTITK